MKDDKPIVLVCQTGKRSTMAATILVQAGAPASQAWRAGWCAGGNTNSQGTLREHSSYTLTSVEIPASSGINADLVSRSGIECSMRPVVLIVLLLTPIARAGEIQFPAVSLPSQELTTPSLLLQPSDLPTLVERETDPDLQRVRNRVQSLVDGNLSGLARATRRHSGDDLLGRLGLGAALLQQLGETPSSSFTTYRDAAVAALTNIGSRTPGSIPAAANNINDLQDSPRLQSMVEGYDLLRGTGVAASDDTTMRGIIANWADALTNDYNLTGAPVLGISGHRDNWGLKGGSALMSAALGLSSEADAPQWLSFGLQLVNESCAVVCSDTGWYGESPHYLNYMLDDLSSRRCTYRTAPAWTGSRPCDPSSSSRWPCANRTGPWRRSRRACPTISRSTSWRASTRTSRRRCSGPGRTAPRTTSPSRTRRFKR